MKHWEKRKIYRQQKRERKAKQMFRDEYYNMYKNASIRSILYQMLARMKRAAHLWHSDDIQQSKLAWEGMLAALHHQQEKIGIPALDEETLDRFVWDPRNRFNTWDLYQLPPEPEQEPELTPLELYRKKIQSIARKYSAEPHGEVDWGQIKRATGKLEEGRNRMKITRKHLRKLILLEMSQMMPGQTATDVPMLQGLYEKYKPLIIAYMTTTPIIHVNDSDAVGPFEQGPLYMFFEESFEEIEHDEDDLFYVKKLLMEDMFSALDKLPGNNDVGEPKYEAVSYINKAVEIIVTLMDEMDFNTQTSVGYMLQEVDEALEGRGMDPSYSNY